MASGADMTAHIDHIKMISEHLEEVDDPVTEKDLVMILILAFRIQQFGHHFGNVE